ncbi:MAG: recombinase RecA [Candidatus Nitrosotenuis sp.]|nr:MAG: recombinase RecA [Candidatus Nitrosotenuis sp.]
MISTGLEKLDELLGDGIKNGIITDIFGASSTGKTQLVLQIAVNCLSQGGTILYQDTTGNFRPERLLDMLKPKELDVALLDKITVGRITNTQEQFSAISKIEQSDFSLVIIDNITDLFSFEYSKEEQILEKNKQFTKYMKQLASVVFEKKIPVVAVNMIRKINDTEQENLDSVMSLFTHIKIKLSKKPTNYMGEVFPHSGENQFHYKIEKNGLMSST